VRLWANRGPNFRAIPQGINAPALLPSVAARPSVKASSGPSRTRRAETRRTPTSDGTNGKAFSSAVKRATER
jgi:hypothetical protein